MAIFHSIKSTEWLDHKREDGLSNIASFGAYGSRNSMIGLVYKSLYVNKIECAAMNHDNTVSEFTIIWILFIFFIITYK
jgi:hypothetical protein